MKKVLSILLPVLFILSSCSDSASEKNKKEVANKTNADTSAQRPMADLATILAKKEVPVLCYHHIRPAKNESESMKSYSVSPEQFAEQMKALHDSGYQTILPGDLYEYLVHGATLPAKPVMLTFDDTDLEQFTIGATEMKKYNFKGVYFIMTISINRPRYMSEAQFS